MGWTVRGPNTGGGEIFRTSPDRPWGPPSLLYNGYRGFPGDKERPGRDADLSAPSSAMVMKGQSYTSTPPIGRTACTESQCLYKGALYLTSVPVQGCTLPYLSACTRVHFTLPQCLYKGALYLYLANPAYFINVDHLARYPLQWLMYGQDCPSVQSGHLILR